MERILTNYQVEWLSNLRLLSDYEDTNFKKDEITEKTCNFIENNYPGEEEEIMKEFEVLKQKGFVNFEASINQYERAVINNIELTKAGLDYLVILEEDFKERAIYNENISKINQILCTINESCEKLNEKSLLDKIEQCTTISSNIFSSVSSLGSMGQGAIPIICKMLRF